MNKNTISNVVIAMLMLVFILVNGLSETTSDIANSTDDSDQGLTALSSSEYSKQMSFSSQGLLAPATLPVHHGGDNSGDFVYTTRKVKLDQLVYQNDQDPFLHVFQAQASDIESDVFAEQELKGSFVAFSNLSFVSQEFGCRRYFCRASLNLQSDDQYYSFLENVASLLPWDSDYSLWRLDDGSDDHRKLIVYVARQGGGLPSDYSRVNLLN